MTEKLYELMTRIGITRGQDKVLHMIGGFIIGAVITYIVGGAIGFLVGFGVALAKELYDKYNDGTVDYFDMFFTLLSAVLGVMLIGGLLNIDPLLNVDIASSVVIGILAIYGVATWYLFGRK